VFGYMSRLFTTLQSSSSSRRNDLVIVSPTSSPLHHSSDCSKPVQFGTGKGVMMLSSWNGNLRLCIALAVGHRTDFVVSPATVLMDLELRQPEAELRHLDRYLKNP